MPRTIQADGRVITVPDDATAEEINQIVGPPQTRPAGLPAGVSLPTLPPHPGVTMTAPTHPNLLSAGLALGDSFGLDANPTNRSIGDAVKTGIEGPAAPVIRSAYQGAKRIGGELVDAGKDALNSNIAGAASHTIKSIPIIGPGMDKMADYAADNGATGKDYLRDLKATVTSPEAMATGLGTAIQAAPIAADASVGLGRDIASIVPTRAKAGAIFESLNKDLADHPIPLKSAIAPLQRVTELGARGGTLPKAASDLLTRSQSPIDMTFPEIRDYQSNLSDLSRDAKGSMNGKMLGEIGKLNKGIYSDVFDAADTVGRGEDYAKAMKTYRQAAQLNDYLKTAQTAIGKAAIPALAGAGGYKAYQVMKGSGK